MNSNNKKNHALIESLGKILDNYSLVNYFPLDITDEDNIFDLYMMIDNTIQFGEDANGKIADHEPILVQFYRLFFIRARYFLYMFKVGT